MTYKYIALSTMAAAAITFTGCGGGSSTSTEPTVEPTTGYCTDANTIAGTISTNLTLTQDTCLDGKVQVASGATLTASEITIAGATGTKAWIEVLPGGKIVADNVIFTSEEEANGGTGVAGQWGGLTLIGNDNKDEAGTAENTQISGGYEVDGQLAGAGTKEDNSGSLTNCTLNNTGIAVEQDKEINGLSLFAVGSGTVIQGITVNRSGDDAVEIWGGHVNLTDINISEAGDDGFDTDDGWAGSVTNLVISGATNSGMELSGNTHATYENVTIDTTGAVATSDVGGAIYLKKTSIGGTFTNVTITDNADTGYGTIVTDAADLENLDGNVTITGTNTNGAVTEGPNYDATVATTVEVAAALNID